MANLVQNEELGDRGSGRAVSAVTWPPERPSLKTLGRTSVDVAGKDDEDDKGESDTVWRDPATGSESVSPDQPSMQACRFCLGIDNQRNMISPCNCKGSLNHAHRNCVATQIFQKRKLTCHVCHYYFNVKWNRKKALREWLLDKDNLADHVLFTVSLAFSVTLVVVLTLAWLQALDFAGQLHWLLSVLLGFVLVFQSCLWIGYAVYSFW